jgi:hypothetical protein
MPATISEWRSGQIDTVWAGGGRMPLDLTVGGYWRSDLVVAVAICHNRMFHAAELNANHPYAQLRSEIGGLTQAALARSGWGQGVLFASVPTGAGAGSSKLRASGFDGLHDSSPTRPAGARVMKTMTMTPYKISDTSEP